MTLAADGIEDHDIVIIGSGIAGLACAARLLQAGMRPVVLDKGRGLGGRVATRRAEGFQFDHGAQYVHAKTAPFATLIEKMRTAGAVADWTIDTGRLRAVGTPGMSALAKYLASGLEVRQGVQVGRVLPTSRGWHIETVNTAPTRSIRAAQLVITVPAPQISVLLGDDHPLLSALAGVTIAPCLTLMAAITDSHTGFTVRETPEGDDDLLWIARDSSKPGRVGSYATCWVAQAGTGFSQAHVDDELSTIAARMLPILCDRLKVSTSQVVHSSAHRWRYARVTQPLGRPFLRAEEAVVYLGGDWCIGPRVEAAWQSGTAIAEDILERAGSHG